MWLTAQLKKAGGLQLGRGLVQAGEGFRVQGEGVDENTGEAECRMVWEESGTC